MLQLERGEESERLHFQGRVSFKSPKRATEVGRILKAHASAEVNEDDAEFYCTKEDTRVHGPWSDKDAKVVIPRDIKELGDLFDWQDECLKLMSTYNVRKVDLVYDSEGNSGKTTLMRKAMVLGVGQLLPAVNDAKDLLRMAYCVGPKKAYFFDMPRAMNKDRLFSFWSAVETLKSGYCYDDRYAFKQRMMDPPNVWIFTNVLPDMSLLSKDRWRLWTIADRKLVLHNP